MKKLMIKMFGRIKNSWIALFLALILVCFFTVTGAGFVRTSIVREQEKHEDILGIRTVIAEGLGETYEKAKDDALENAVKQVVGTYISSRLGIENDELIEEHLAASNAEVEDYDVLSNSANDELIRVKIKAVVKKGNLDMLVADAKEAKADVNGAKILEKLTKKRQDEINRLTAIAEKFETFPEYCVKFSAGMIKDDIILGGNDVTVPVKLTVSVDKRNFKGWRRETASLLEKFRVESGSLSLESYPPQPGAETEKEQLVVYLNTAFDAKKNSTKWDYYTLPKRARKLFAEKIAYVPVVDIELYGEDGTTVNSKRIALPETNLAVTFSRYSSSGDDESQNGAYLNEYAERNFNSSQEPVWLLGFFNEENIGKEQLIIKYKFTLSQENFNSVKGVRCVFVSRPISLKERRDELKKKIEQEDEHDSSY